MKRNIQIPFPKTRDEQLLKNDFLGKHDADK